MNQSYINGLLSHNAVGLHNIDTEEPTSSNGEARKQLMERCTECLIHSCQCLDTDCQALACQEMKRLLAHTKTCPWKRHGGCLICTLINAICCYHAKVCHKSECSVLFCRFIKQKLYNPQEVIPEMSWHQSLSVGLRDYYAHKLANTLSPWDGNSSGPEAAVIHKAKNIERDVFKTSRSRCEYYHLIAEKIEDIKEISKMAKGKARAIRSLAVQLSGGPLTVMLTSATKDWRHSTTTGLRNILVLKQVQVIFPNADQAAMLNEIVQSLVSFVRKWEQDVYETANTRSEYFYLLAEKTHNFEVGFEKRSRERNAIQLQQ